MTIAGTPSRLHRVLELASVVPVVAVFVARVTWELTATERGSREVMLESLWLSMTGDPITPRSR